ncbi:MAG: glycosyltransferase family 2 protein [Candidatus Omnitrophica bacterium]|nr:glycosyltransferase family 2 protein [Candidatus Omnitrophota bacterium]
MEKDKEKVSIIIPCYNEEDSLVNLFSKMKEVERAVKSKYNLEIIFIDDGSKDKTCEMLYSRYGARADVFIVTYPINKGYGYALREGLKRIGGDLIVTIDADTNYDHREIPVILSLMDKNTHIIVASPFSLNGKWYGLDYRLFLSMELARIYKFLLAGKSRGISTYTSCLRVYRKSILESIIPDSNDFVANAEILIRAIVKGYKIKEYPTKVYRREFGKSKMKIVKTIASHIRFIFKIIRKDI